MTFKILKMRKKEAQKIVVQLKTVLTTPIKRSRKSMLLTTAWKYLSKKQLGSEYGCVFHFHEVDKVEL